MMPLSIHTRFAGQPGRRWRQTTSGGGRIDVGANGLYLGNDMAASRRYTNAQIDDYRGLARSDFPWRPPLRLHVGARFSHASGELTGTAGFGFWNDPFRIAGLRAPALPQAVWFFYAGPDSDMRLALDRPGWGWKAAVVAARTGGFLISAPFLALCAPLMRLPRQRRRLWKTFQRAAGIAEAVLPAAMPEWHIYTIDWQRERVRFFVDGRLQAETPRAPAGPLGLVLWLDNQYLQIAPWGRFRWGLSAKEGQQWLEIDWLAVESGHARVTGRPQQA